VRHPGVGCHIGEHGRATEVSGVGGHKQKAAFQRQDGPKRRLFDCRGVDGIRQNGTKCDGVEGFAFDGPHVPKEIEKDYSARREAERNRHIEHRPFAGEHARLRQRLNVVGYRFDAGVGATAQRIRAQEQRNDEYQAHLLGQKSGLVDRIRQ
jgi:hypothetical protein